MQKIVQFTTLCLGCALAAITARQTTMHTDAGQQYLAPTSQTEKPLRKHHRQHEHADGKSRPPALKARPRESASYRMPGLLTQRIFEEYGAVFAANKKKAITPSTYFFHTEAELKAFQARVKIAREFIGGIWVELQAQAMKDLLAARSEAKLQHLNISPRGKDASRRSYADSVKLWNGRVEAGFKHWLSYGKITSSEAERVRSLSLEKQALQVLEWEARGLYFGNGFKKSILESVAFPGSSQHHLMLALDIEQYNNPQVRLIMARHGWFQTVKNDTPHFTYLGVEESALPSLGLKADYSSGRTVWLPKSKTRANEAPAMNKKDGSTRNRDKAALEDQNAEKTSRSNGASSRDNITNPFASARMNIHAIISPQAVVPPKMVPLLQQLTRRYFENSDRLLYITSAYRSPERQALAMYFNIIRYGISHVTRTYKGKAAVVEIIEAYRTNRGNPGQAARAMTAVIQSQINRGSYISDHMLGRAFDIRLSSAKLSLLREAARSMGGTVVVEPDHYHVGL